MNDTPIPRPRDCALNVPGHTVHWIQARLAHRQPQPHVQVEVVGFDGSAIVAATHDGVRRLQNHDIDRVRAIVALHGPAGVLVGYGVLQVGPHLVCVSEDQQHPLAPCVRAEDARPAT